jgi:hypothetical protein
MSYALQIFNSAMATAAVLILVKLYAEHVDVKTKVSVLWRWWEKTYGEGKKP